MGVVRNGSSSFLKAMRLACKWSHMPGFQAGLRRAIGEEPTDTIMSLWSPLCEFIEVLIAADDYAFQKDYTGGETHDVPLPP